jgi:hypothetical protein
MKEGGGEERTNKRHYHHQGITRGRVHWGIIIFYYDTTLDIEVDL